LRINHIAYLLLAVLLVSTLSTAQSETSPIPAPGSVLGFEPGTDRQLMDYGQLIGYLNKLAAASPRIEMREVGTSPLGRPMYVCFISAAENIERLDELRAINRRLALEPSIPDDEIVGLVRDGRVFLMETLSMHSEEVGPSQSLPIFAHRMSTTEDPELLARLDDVVLMMVPCHNPDGMDMVVEHYRKYLGTVYEGSSMPGVYHRYVGHDNNRDFVALTQEDTRVISALFSTEWYPQVLVEKHQMGSTGPRYFVPPFHDPIALNTDEGLLTWSSVFGTNLSRDLAAGGLRGVASHWAFDNYWPGSTETSLYKNIISFLTEAASCRTGTPVFVEPTELSVRGKGLSEYKKGVNLPFPWPGGTWGLGDIVSYELSSMSSILATASRHRTEILRFRNDLTRKQVEMGRSQAPYYFVLPLDQRDPGELGALIELLQEHGVTVERLNQATVVGELHLKAGDIVVPLSQPYRSFAKEVLEDQRYPERHYTPGGELIRPYDITSWSLPRHTGIKAIQVDIRSEELESRIEPVGKDVVNVAAPKGVTAMLLSSSINESYRTVFAALNAGLKVSRATKPIKQQNGTVLPAGTFVIPLSKSVMKIVEGATVPPVFLESEPPEDLVPVVMPRVALVETWFHDMDAGWTRYLFDTYGIAYRVLHPGDFDEVELAEEFDLIVFPAASKEVLTEGKQKWRGRYYPTGYPPEYSKPISKAGLGKITAFIENGGTVVSWGGSTSLFTEGLAKLPDDKNGDDNSDKNGDKIELPVRDVTKELKDVLVPGAFLAVDFIADHPLAWGMPRESGAFTRGTPVFATSIPVLDTDRRVIGTYPERDLLISGYLAGEKELQNRPAMVWVRAGKGQLVLFGFQPQFRGSTPSTFKLVFNALLLPPVKARNDQ